MKLLGLLSMALLIASAAAAQTAKPPTTNSQTSAAGTAGVTSRMQTQGYKDIHDLRRGPDGQWVGKATRNGVPVTVTVGSDGNATAR